MTDHIEFADRTVVIVGVGLIGGSLAAAIRKRFPACRVIGIGRNESRLRQAVESGLIQETATEISGRTVPESSLGVVCLPVDRIAEAVTQLANCGCTAVTDAGSVKAPICRRVAAAGCRRFVGSHPVAGSEQSGFEAADAELFERRVCVMTPVDADVSVVQRVSGLWAGVGMQVRMMSPEEHDRILALTSHLPHVLASVAAGCVSEDMLPFTGTGYRDTTRIAMGSADVWSSILLENAESCLQAIHIAEDQLQSFRIALQTRDSASLTRIWERNAAMRRRL